MEQSASKLCAIPLSAGHMLPSGILRCENVCISFIKSRLLSHPLPWGLHLSGDGDRTLVHFPEGLVPQRH